MPKLILDNAKVVVNGVDLSNHCAAVTIEDAAEDINVSGFSSVAYSTDLTGFKDVTITATFWQDYAAGNVHRVLQPLYDAGTVFDVAVTPEAALPVSDTNPQFVLPSRLFDYSPLEGLVGDAVDFDVEFHNAGTGLSSSHPSYSFLTGSELWYPDTMLS